VIKKVLITLLVVLHFGVSIGATLHFEYCMGRLIKISLGNNHAKNCHACGMFRKVKAVKKCCKDKYKQLKTEKTTLSVVTGQSFSAPTATLRYPSFCNPASSHPAVLEAHPEATSPPQITDVSIFLQYCTFRI